MYVSDSMDGATDARLDRRLSTGKTATVSALENVFHCANYSPGWFTSDLKWRNTISKPASAIPQAHDRSSCGDHAMARSHRCQMIPTPESTSRHVLSHYRALLDSCGMPTTQYVPPAAFPWRSPMLRSRRCAHSRHMHDTQGSGPGLAPTSCLIASTLLPRQIAPS